MLKAYLIRCNIPTDSCEYLAQNHSKWRRSICDGAAYLKGIHLQRLSEGRGVAHHKLPIDLPCQASPAPSVGESSVPTLGTSANLEPTKLEWNKVILNLKFRGIAKKWNGYETSHRYGVYFEKTSRCSVLKSVNHVKWIGIIVIQ